MQLERLYEWNALFRIVAVTMFPLGVYAFLQIGKIDLDTFNVFDYMSYASAVVMVYLLVKYVFWAKSKMASNIDEFDNRGFLDNHEGWFIGLDITNMKESENNN